MWYVLSDEPTDVKTFEEYGLRFDIEENFLDDKANGLQLESSLIRSAQALTRLCLVLALTTLYLVTQGTEVVKQGKRRWVDPHWWRGQSYLKIGWNWVKLALSKGLDLITTVHLSSACDPEPAMASKRQYQHVLPNAFRFRVPRRCMKDTGFEICQPIRSNLSSGIYRTRRSDWSFFFVDTRVPEREKALGSLMSEQCNKCAMASRGVGMQ